MMLLINTTEPDQTSLYLLEKGMVKAEVWQSSRTQSEQLHLRIGNFLKKNLTSLKDLKKIGVVTGPGFFSRIRSGVVTANTLAYALSIPVVGHIQTGQGINFTNLQKQKGSKSVEPFYNREPNISKPKK